MPILELTECRPKIIFQDLHLLIINKPSGMHSAESTRSISERDPSLTLASWLATTVSGEMRLASLNPEDSGLVQRLDYYTSGLIIAAKSRAVWLTMREIIQSQRLHKEYRVMLEGNLEKATEVKVALGSPYRHSKKVLVYESLNKKRSQVANTRFDPLNYFEDLLASEVRVTAPEGRRHQVRACASYIGHPLVGDDLYGAKSKTGCPTKFWLHAEKLKFVHPVSQLQVEYSAPLPEDWPLS